MLLSKLFRFLKFVIIVSLCAMLLSNLYIITARIVFKNNMPKIFGFTQIIVISGSMQPEIKVGDMLIIKKQSSYDINEIVTYRWGKAFVTHRIVGIIAADENKYITKGDSNNVADEPITISTIEGKVVMRIPGFGNIISFLRTPFGFLVITFGVILLIEIPIIVGKLKHKKNR